jgi:hypothetical protein
MGGEKDDSWWWGEWNLGKRKGDWCLCLPKTDNFQNIEIKEIIFLKRGKRKIPKANLPCSRRHLKVLKGLKRIPMNLT